VLFADLAGSTALGERLDPEDVRELQGELFDLVNAEVEGHGGVTEKFVGDAILAVFGIPQAHDDDAERAVRAALAVREVFPDFAARVSRRHGLEVGLRVGVNTGEVVAGREAAARGELMVSGDAVNVAARLQQRAEPGQVLVGERSVASTRRAIRYRDLGTAAAKGKRAPVRAWEALSVSAAPGQRGYEGLTASLIGRDEELEVLRALTARVERERVPQLVTLFGQAGVGKSRLLDEFVARLPQGRRLQGRCLPYGDGITYWPLAEAAKGHAGVLDSDPATTALEKLRTVIQLLLGTDAERVLEAVAWTIGLVLPGTSASDSTDVAARLREAWTKYLAALGRERLTVLAIEDVHWASEPLLDLLEQLTERLEDTAVLTVCTARPEFLDARPAWGGGIRNASSISLSPLPPDESELLVVELLGADGLPAEMTARVVDRAGGNPFYVEEILQMLIERGAIARENGHWVIRDALPDAEIPDSVHGVIAARIDLLDADARDALRRCSVMGRVFWPPAVGVEEELIAGLGRGGLVSEQPASMIAQMREFAFKHALTRDVAYTTLPRPERGFLHRKVGEWLEGVAPGREAETAELAAFHYAKALEYSERDEQVTARAFALFLSAGETALARAALASAEPLLDRALELAANERERALALFALGRTDIALSRGEGAIARLDLAEAAAQAVADPILRSDILGWQSRAFWLAGRRADAIRATEDAIVALQGLPETPQLARALARRSQLEMLGSVPAAVEHAREAVDVARRVGDGFAEANARTNLFTELANEGVEPDAQELDKIVELALAAGAYDEAFRAVVNLVWSAQAYWHVDTLERVIAAAVRPIAHVAAPELFDAYLTMSLAKLISVPAGRWTDADAAVAEVGYLSRATHLGSNLVWLEVAGGLALRRGDLTRAGELMLELQQGALAVGEPQRIVPMASIVVPWAAHAGDQSTVAHIADAVLTLAARSWAPTFSAVGVARGLAAAGELDRLARLVSMLRAVPSESWSGNQPISLAASDGLLALAAGELHAAVERLAEAVHLERSLGRAYNTACLELDLATALDAAGDGTGADESRARAAAVLEPLGCVNAY